METLLQIPSPQSQTVPGILIPLLFNLHGSRIWFGCSFRFCSTFCGRPWVVGSWCTLIVFLRDVGSTPSSEGWSTVHSFYAYFLRMWCGSCCTKSVGAPQEFPDGGFPSERMPEGLWLTSALKIFWIIKSIFSFYCHRLLKRSVQTFQLRLSDNLLDRLKSDRGGQRPSSAWFSLWWSCAIESFIWRSR